MEEKKIQEDLEAGKLDIDNMKAAYQRRKKAIIRAMNHTNQGWISKV